MFATPRNVVRVDHQREADRIISARARRETLAPITDSQTDQPNFGPLTNQMVLDNGALVPGTVVQPKVEPEVALRFATPLIGECSIDEVLDATESAHACLEIVDTVWADYRFGIEDNTADGSSAAFICIGAPIPIATIDRVTVELRRNGDPVGHGVGADASGHPALGVVWLVAQLAQHGTGIAAGDIVITGGLTQAVDFCQGDVIDAMYDGTLAVSVRR